jgi:hypothetical protein
LIGTADGLSIESTNGVGRNGPDLTEVAAKCGFFGQGVTLVAGP